MRLTDSPEHKESEGHVFFSTLGTLVLQEGMVLEAEVAFLWDRAEPLAIAMDIEAFPDAQIVPNDKVRICHECGEIIQGGALFVPDLDDALCTTCVPVDPGMTAIWTISLDQLASALEDRADRPADLGDIQMTRHLGSRLKMRLFNGEAWCFLDFSAHRLEQLINAIDYARACHGGADELTSVYVADGIRKFEEYLGD